MARRTPPIEVNKYGPKWVPRWWSLFWRASGEQKSGHTSGRREYVFTKRDANTVGQQDNTRKSGNHRYQHTRQHNRCHRAQQEDNHPLNSVGRQKGYPGRICGGPLTSHPIQNEDILFARGVVAFGESSGWFNDGQSTVAECDYASDDSTIHHSDVRVHRPQLHQHQTRRPSAHLNKNHKSRYTIFSPMRKERSFAKPSNANPVPDLQKKHCPDMHDPVQRRVTVQHVHDDIPSPTSTLVEPDTLLHEHTYRQPRCGNHTKGPGHQCSTPWHHVGHHGFAHARYQHDRPRHDDDFSDIDSDSTLDGHEHFSSSFPVRGYTRQRSQDNHNIHRSSYAHHKHVSPQYHHQNTPWFSASRYDRQHIPPRNQDHGRSKSFTRTRYCGDEDLLESPLLRSSHVCRAQAEYPADQHVHGEHVTMRRGVTTKQV